ELQRHYSPGRPLRAVLRASAALPGVRCDHGRCGFVLRRLLGRGGVPGRRLHHLRAAAGGNGRGDLRRLPGRTAAAGADPVGRSLRRYRAEPGAAAQVRAQDGARADHGPYAATAGRADAGRAAGPGAAPSAALVGPRVQPGGADRGRAGPQEWGPSGPALAPPLPPHPAAQGHERVGAAASGAGGVGGAGRRSCARARHHPRGRRVHQWEHCRGLCPDAETERRCERRTVDLGEGSPPDDHPL
ncbi:MAG: Competence protein F homolog, phosphoribosyltransferase domain; protein YhgH required for utilization of DNA as sole source of carbon and energy, partial [uncultured Sphingomonas sp.]